MKKSFLSLAIVLAAFGFSNRASAQTEGMGVSVGAEVALPSGDLSTTNSTGFGGSAMFHYNLIENTLDLTGSAGYIMFGGKTTTLPLVGDVTSPSVSAIPIRVGANWFPIEDLGVYVGAELGLTMYKSSETTVTIPSIFPGFPAVTTTVPGSSTTAFGFAPRIGYSLPIGDNALDLQLRYDLSPGIKSTTEDAAGNTVETTTTYGFIGFRAAYRFNFGN